ncbi:MAG: efflux RND transporter periplasmic adaptor subunit [Chloroflexi bacterium]|nr:efflux RND transporter periplasmic adaptor subunit [Chloroflexota bacterium]
MLKSRRLWAILGGIALLLICGGVVASRVLASRQQNAAELKTGDVSQITAVSSVESSGSVAAQQSATVFWGTTGKVATVNVKAGDKVNAGDVLMTVDPASAPQNVVLAQADIITAQKALDELLHPANMTIANAQKAVADAQDALDKARRDLISVETPGGKSVADALSDAKLALDNAQANVQLAANSSDVQALNNAAVQVDEAFRFYQDAKAKYDASNEKTEYLALLQQAQAAYNNALANQQTIALRAQTDQANKDDALKKAQDKYEQAQANFNAAQLGPDANKLAIAKAKVAVAEATLADAKDKLDKLTNGADPNDIAVAKAKVQAAQAAVEALTIKAPFAGEVLVVNYQPGDAVSQSLAAVVMANRSVLHVDVSVDETDVSDILPGDPVTVTFNSLPDLNLDGQVSQINPVGSAVQGLVKYTVRVDLVKVDPKVLLGMTADVSIVTDKNEGALAVPLDAVQLDPQGEFVNRVKADNTLERVNVVSGEVQGELVVVTGDLKPGDKVQMVEPKPTDNGSPFGPG